MPRHGDCGLTHPGPRLLRHDVTGQHGLHQVGREGLRGLHHTQPGPVGTADDEVVLVHLLHRVRQGHHGHDDPLPGGGTSDVGDERGRRQRPCAVVQQNAIGSVDELSGVPPSSTVDDDREAGTHQASPLGDVRPDEQHHLADDSGTQEPVDGTSRHRNPEQ